MPKNCVLFELQAKGKSNYKEPLAANTAQPNVERSTKAKGWSAPLICRQSFWLPFFGHTLLSTSFKLASTNTGFLHLVWNL
jgi:hypothetical protein